MRFAQSFAVPCLLFRAVSTLDIGGDLDFRLLFVFYTGALTGFAVAFLGARLLFKRGWDDAIAFGFVGLFSNALLLGVPIAERAFGADKLHFNFMIVAFHSPFCFAVGMTAMEVLRNRGASLRITAGKVVKAMFSNGLVIGVSLGAVWNLGNLPAPEVATDAIDLVAHAALPAALFGLGGVLYRYSPEGDLRAIAWVCCASLIVHPTVTLLLGNALGLSNDALRAAVMTAAMAPGVNSYLFAHMYGAARRVAASAVLLGTAASVLSSWMWLTILP